MCDTAKLHFPQIHQEIKILHTAVSINSLETWTKTWSVEAHKAKDVKEQAKMKKTEIAFMKVGK